MGCDIHSFAEVHRDGKWEPSGAVFPLSDFGREWEKRNHTEHPFNWRSYNMFGFLANVRNYSHVPCIQKPTCEMPQDASPLVIEAYSGWKDDAHSLNVLTAKQLLDYDYEQTFWDRRVTKQLGPNAWTGAGLAEEGEGETVKLRDFLGADFFRDLEVLKTLGNPDDVRVIFWFDN